MLDDVTLIIKTFERPKALDRLLGSIAEKYPECPVLIADDSQSPYRDEMLRKHGGLIEEYITLPFDSGLSFGRNELLERVRTKFFVLNDDDFVYGPQTDLGWMRSQLDSTDLELLGGVYLEPKTVHWSGLRQPTLKQTARSIYQTLRTLLQRARGKTYSIDRFHGRISATDDAVRLVHDDTPGASPFRRCDYTTNFFMANTEAVRSKVSGWCEELKLQEHWEFFYRAKLGGLRVAHTDDVGVIHLRDRDPVYNEYRERQDKYRRLGLQLHDLHELRIGPLLRVTAPPTDVVE